jgi:hypothetical protein
MMSKACATVLCFEAGQEIGDDREGPSGSFTAGRRTATTRRKRTRSRDAGGEAEQGRFSDYRTMYRTYMPI